MGRLKLVLVLQDLLSDLARGERLVMTIQHWHNAPVRGLPRIRSLDYDLVTELSFLKSYLAWEFFLEQSFVLYMLGKQSPKRYSPRRHVHPKNRDHALQIARGEQRFADWTAVMKVINRAERCFKNGEPYNSSLSSYSRSLKDMKVIRNAIAHSSYEARTEFEKLVRARLTYYPKGLTIGKFLNTINSTASLPETFFETYVNSLRAIAQKLIP